MAIYLNNYAIERFTEDIDFIGYDEDEIFIKLVQEVAFEFNLKEDWINSRADTTKPYPELKGNLISLNDFKSINAKVVNRITIIRLKVYAAHQRGAKDIVDLKLLRPNKQEIDLGIDHIKKSIKEHHGEHQLIKNIEEFRSCLYENL